jgi:hypothetical protein
VGMIEKPQCNREGRVSTFSDLVGRARIFGAIQIYNDADTLWNIIGDSRI